MTELKFMNGFLNPVHFGVIAIVGLLIFGKRLPAVLRMLRGEPPDPPHTR